MDANHPATLATGFAYNAAGAVTSMDYGNGLRMTRTFNSGMQLKTLRHGTVGSPGSILNYEYGYQEGVSNTGQIMGIIDYNDRTKDVSYTYDRFHRLQTAETAGMHWGLTWTYDRYGNRSAQTVTKGTAPANSLSVNAATNRVSAWTYDAAGNTLSDGRHTYTYNALNQQTTMDGATEYRYDASGSRVMKISGGTTTYYVLGAGEYVSGTWQRLYVSVNGAKLLEYASGTTYFFHADHLGTPRAQTSLAGAVVGSWSNYPYGEQWQQSGVTNKDRYTGKERDDESYNYYFGARYYFHGNARWLAVDPVPFQNPAQLSGYAYSFNDPVNNIDDDGRIIVEIRCSYWFTRGNNSIRREMPYCEWIPGFEGTRPHERQHTEGDRGGPKNCSQKTTDLTGSLTVELRQVLKDGISALSGNCKKFFENLGGLDKLQQGVESLQFFDATSPNASDATLQADDVLPCSRPGTLELSGRKQVGRVLANKGGISNAVVMGNLWPVLNGTERYPYIVHEAAHWAYQKYDSDFGRLVQNLGFSPANIDPNNGALLFTAFLQAGCSGVN